MRPSRMWVRLTPFRTASTQQSTLGSCPGDDALPDQERHLAQADLGDQGALVVPVPEQAPDVGEQDQLLCPRATAILAAAVSALTL